MRFAAQVVVGYVVEIIDGNDESLQNATFEINPIIAPVDGPYFDENAVETARWIAREYGSPLAVAIRLFTPSSGKFVVRETVDGTFEAMNSASGHRFEYTYSLTEKGREFVPRPQAKKQIAILSQLKDFPRTYKELRGAVAGADHKTMQLLEAHGYVECEIKRVYRGDITPASMEYVRPEKLTAGQITALDAIAEATAAGAGVVVLDGITGSGKTEVYLQAIEKTLESGQGAIALVPEISLTPQTVGRFKARFGDLVAVVHSKLSDSEKQDQWDRIQSGDARVVVGARSALFAPLAHTGLIIIDEEHDSSYKQSSSPRYHARDVAVFMARLRHIPLVLGSATPSFEALNLCAENRWKQVVLDERANHRALPEVTVVDLTKEFEEGNHSMFSRELAAALETVEAKKQKAILLLNRRGSASFLLCRECGYVPHCKNCSTSLTYHEHNNHLRCHQCNLIEPLPGVCPECGSPYLRQFGAGTQRLESELKALFPAMPVVRMDADTTTTKNAHQKLLAQFADLEYGVLLGTQMIAKGLDFPEVTLVGVVTADVTLNLPDYQAGERTYQLLEQVAGRAGRGEETGRVIIQTYWADHPAIVAAQKHDRSLFYEPESEVRRELRYPPYVRLANVILSAVKETDAKEYAESLGKAFADETDITLLGPAPCALSRINNKFRYHLLIKAKRGVALGDIVLEKLKSVPSSHHVGVAVDVDPLSLM
ncbi:MAG: primosomal protein N' [Coriobacteriia bacterium]|nr:primosomal protein N' [Coriobacteriia bacterium]